MIKFIYKCLSAFICRQTERIYMTKKKKILIISLFGFILVGLVSAYVIYGSTLIDITNEKSINKYLSDDEKNSVTILAMDTYQDYALVVYTTSEDLDSVQKREFIKHKLYKNRYRSVGSRNQTNGYSVSLNRVRNADFEDENVYAISNVQSDYTSCSIFEIDNNTMRILKKVDEVDVPNKAYIIFKEYRLESEDHSLIAFNGSLDMNDEEIVELNLAAG